MRKRKIEMEALLLVCVFSYFLFFLWSGNAEIDLRFLFNFTLVWCNKLGKRNEIDS